MLRIVVVVITTLLAVVVWNYRYQRQQLRRKYEAVLSLEGREFSGDPFEKWVANLIREGFRDKCLAGLMKMSDDVGAIKSYSVKLVIESFTDADWWLAQETIFAVLDEMTLVDYIYERFPNRQRVHEAQQQA